jgi:hypothetical protein
MNLDAVGSHIKFRSLIPGDKTSRNIEVVQNYIDWITKQKFHEIPSIQFLLDSREEIGEDD